jgi:hypothetical protein
MEFLGMCCVVALGLPLFCLVWAAVVRRIRPKHYWLWIVASIPGFFVVLFCWIEAVSFHATRPTVVFRESFGFDPTPDVRILHSFREPANKWDTAYLEFYADESTIDRILQNGLAPISTRGIIRYGSQPEWWTPYPGPGVRVYTSHPEDPELPGESHGFTPRDLLVYDPASRKAYYRYWHWW